MPTRSTRRVTSRKSNAKGTAAVPAALARRATAAATARHARLLKEAREHLALIARRKKAITEAFYEIGLALAELKKRDMIAALGRKSFAEVCEKDAKLSVTLADRLIGIVQSMTPEQALDMGQTKAMALVSLAAATPENDTAAGLFRKKKIALPGGRSIDPRAASANAIESAAIAIRHRNAAKSTRAGGNGKAARGRTTTAEERTFAALLERKLHKLGLDRARVTAVATKPGQAADLRFEHIPVSKVDALKQAIGR